MQHPPGARSAAVAILLAAPLPLFAQVAPATNIPAANPATTAQPPPSQLPEIRVREQGMSNLPPYQGGTTNIGRTRQLPKDVPQALTIIPEQLMQDQNATTLRDALRNVPGLTFNAGEGGRIGDNFNLRGFYSFGDIYLDGIRDVAQINRDLFNLEQVDVLRGSASMLFGRGGAGGVINSVSKSPSPYAKSDVGVLFGTHLEKRATVDVNRPMGQDNAFRFNAMIEDSQSTRDTVVNDRVGIAPSIRFGIGSRHDFTLAYYHLKTNMTLDYGVPYFNGRPVPVPTSTFYGTRNDYEDNVTNMLTATYVFRMTPDTEVRTVVRQARFDRDLWGVAPRLAAGTTALTPTTVVNRQRQARGGTESNITVQSDLTTRFTTGAYKHEALIGFEYLGEDASRWSYNAVATAVAPATTLFNPNPGDPLPLGYGNQQRAGVNSYTGTTLAVYAQDLVEVARGWKVLLGLRNDQLKSNYSNGAVVDYGQLSWRSGVLYQPTEEATYYFTHGSSFNPTADLYQFTNATVTFPAERTRTTELGAKWELRDGLLSVRTSLYRTEKTWERNTDVESAQTATLLSKRRHTDGLELELAGRITPNWDIFGGVAFMKATIDEAPPGGNPNLVGMRPRNAPPYTASLWSTYRLPGGWRVGGGVQAVANRLAYGTAGTTPIATSMAPHYLRWDAMILYEQPKYTLRLNVLNLFDKDHYASVYDNGGHVIPSIGRTVQLSALYKF